MSDLSLRKRYDAVLFRLKSQQLELHVQITSMLEDPHVDLADIQEVIEDYTQIEGAFLTFKQMVGDYLAVRKQAAAPRAEAPRAAPAPRQPPPMAQPAPAAPAAAVPVKTVTAAASPTLKRSQALRKNVAKKPATKKKAPTRKAKTESDE